jgi:hypothetical protein
MRHPERLVSVIDDLPGVASYDVGLSQPEWSDLERSGIFDHVALAWYDENNLTGASRPAQVRLMSVTPNYFAVLGVAPQLGRTFPAENRSPGYLGEIVISDGLWKGNFGGDPHILGQEHPPRHRSVSRRRRDAAEFPRPRPDGRRAARRRLGGHELLRTAAVLSAAAAHAQHSWSDCAAAARRDA